MNAYHKKAIELKYAGNTYDEISRALGRKFSVNTLKHHFALDGLLYLPYLEYEARQNGWNEETAKKEYKRLAGHMSKVKLSLLKRAIDTGDLRLAYDIARDVEDRAGLVVVRKTEVKDERPKGELTNEQLADQLRGMGIDPRTGLSVRSTKTTPN